jgi:uncharacterized protein (DUF736 family)
MKKNFFKKLALVMALAVTVTSVPSTSASAAAAPKFKSSAVKVNVGQTKKYSTANTTKYSVSFKIGNKSVATIAKSGKAVKVTGVAAGKTTLKATFKNYKTKKVTTAKVPVTVIEEATTLKTVEAKGVKTLVATFNKAVDTTKAVVAVTKGSAKPSITSTTWADDKKSVTVVMGSKLTEGTYEVSVTGLTADALKGSVTVKDETLTSVEIIGTNLVADASTASTATIGFKTLNQYGERMSVTTPNVTSSFGTANVTQDCTPTKTGVVTVTNIISTLQVVGTSGSVTVVDTTKGINATATVTYSAPASAKVMTIAGLYNVTDGKIKDITKGDTVADYVLLATVADQYGNALNAAKLNGKVTPNLVAGGGVSAVGTWTDKTIDGKDYVALSLVGNATDLNKATTGTFYFTFVNPTLGLLANTSFTVKSGTVIKTLSISANDTIYQGQDNELAFEAVDTDGNAVTKYSTLTDLVSFTLTGSNNTTNYVKFVKKADGTAKLVYKPANTLDTTYGAGLKKSTIATFTASVNDSKTTSYFVKSLTFTTYQKRVAKEVTGLKAATATAVASGQSFKLYATDLVVEDQYSNVMSDSEVKGLTNINVATTGDIVVSGDASGAFPTAANNHYVTLTAGSSVNSTTTLKLGIGNLTDYTATLSTVDPTKATNFVIKKINSNDVVVSTNAQSLTAADVQVTGTVGGKTVVIPTSQYTVSGNTGYRLEGATSVNPAQTLTGTLEVTIDSYYGTVVLTKDYTFSNALAAVTTIDSTEGVTINAGSGTLTKTQLATLFDIKDQYGLAYTGNAVKYEVSDLTNATSRTISLNNTNSVTIVGVQPGDTFSVTATAGTVTKTVQFTAQ